MNSIATLVKTILAFAFFGLSACGESKDVKQVRPQNVISETPFSPSLQDWPHSTSDISPDPRVTYGRLKNGLRYAILPERDDTGAVSIQLNISAGWNDEPEDAYGVAHLLEHVAFRSKREDDDTSIIHDLQSNGVGFGRDFNGFTTAENTYYLITLTSPRAKDISNALSGFKGLIEASALSSETLAVEKKIVLAELNRRNAVQDRASQSYIAFEDPKTARARVSGIGTKESLKNISLQHVRKFHNTHYRPEKTLIIITGDIDLGRARGLIQSEFSDWAESSPDAPEDLERTNETSGELTEPGSFRESGTKSEMRAIEHRPSTRGNDLLRSRKSKFIDSMVISIFQARLDLRVEDAPKVNWMSPYKKRTLKYDVIGVKMGARDNEIGFTIFEEERRRLIKYGLTNEEFTFAFNKSRAAFKRAALPRKSINAPAVASRMRRSFINGGVYNNPQQDLEIFERFEASITKEDLERAAKKTWADFSPKYWTQSSGPMGSVMKRVAAVQDAINEGDIKPPLGEVDKVFQKATFSNIGEIKSRDYVKAEGVHRLLFKNETRLNFKTSREKKNDIIVAISLKPQDGTFLKYYSAIAEKLPSLSWADISGMDRLAMERQFVGQKVQFSLGVFEDRFVLLIVTTPDDLQDSLEIASTFLVNFDPESKDHARSYKKRLDRKKTSVNKSPVQSGVIKLPSAYANNPPAFMSRLSKGYFIDANRDAEIKKIIETGSIEVGIVGDIDKDAAINIFTNTIGAMPRRAPIRVDHLYTDPSVSHNLPSVETITYAGSLDQMAIIYCWPFLPDLDSHEIARRKILSNVILSRFREHIREELGLTYATQVLNQSNRVFPNFGYMCFSAQIEPENEAVTLEGFETVVDSIYDTPITKLEFDRAREPLLSVDKRHESNNFITAYGLARAFSDEPYWQSIEKKRKALKTAKLSTVSSGAKALFISSERSIFRVQHFQSRHITQKNTRLAKSYIGDAEAQLKLGESLLFSRIKKEREQGVEYLKASGKSGEKRAYLQLGKFYRLKGELKLAAAHLEKADVIPEGAFMLSALYMDNYTVFPDISDKRIVELAKHSAEGGFTRGQFFYADRLKDGTFLKRDEIGALKWALVANYLQMGELTLSKEQHIERYQTGLKEDEISQATQEAKIWIKNNPK